MADYNINAVTRRVVYTGSAGTGPYSFTFEILDQNDVAVYFNSTLLTITTDYTVTINANGTGSITIVTGSSVPSTPDGDDSITIVGARDIERTTDFVTAGDLLAASLNEQLDALTIFDQQISERVDRGLLAPVTDPTTIDMTLPAKADRLGKALLFNSTTGNPEAGPTATDIENAQTNAAAAAASAAAASTSETNAATSETNAANSAASAAAAAQGFSGVTLLTASSNDIETTDARTYYQVDASSNTVNLNLPSIGTGNDGLSYTVEVLDVSNAITLVRDGSDTINGVAGNYTGLVEAGQVIQIIADDGTPDNWIVVQSSALKVDDSTVELSGRTIQVKDNGITPAKVAGAIQDQSGTTYTLVLGDAFKTVSLDNASAVAVTVPLNSSVAFSTSDRVDFINEGAGEVTVSGASGVTINDTDGGSFTIAQYGGATIIKVGTDAWIAPNQTVS